MKSMYLSQPEYGCYAAWVDYLVGANSADAATPAANDLGAYIPQLWAQEGLNRWSLTQ